MCVIATQNRRINSWKQLEEKTNYLLSDSGKDPAWKKVSEGKTCVEFYNPNKSARTEKTHVIPAT
jgi:hypothetical protein